MQLKPGLLDLITDETIICRCESIPAVRIMAAIGADNDFTVPRSEDPDAGRDGALSGKNVRHGDRALNRREDGLVAGVGGIRYSAFSDQTDSVAGAGGTRIAHARTGRRQ